MIKIVLSIILFFAFLIISFKLLTGYIYVRKDCERFNIDNLEGRTGVNVPAVVDGDCECDGKIKESSFTLDIEDNKVESYLSKNRFKKVSDYYQRKGVNEDTKWDVIFNPENKKLSFVDEYLDD